MNALHSLRNQRSLRKLLKRLTAIWIVIYVPTLSILAVRGDILRSLHWLLDTPAWFLTLVTLHGLVVTAGWSLVGYGWWVDRRRQIQERIIAESLADLHAMPPAEFEKFVTQVFRDHGFKAWDIRFTADHGVDLQLIAPDGASAVAQVKRYEHNVGEPAARDLYGTMMHAGAERAYLINTGGFSEPAQQWVKGKPITLIDGRTLLHMNGTPTRHTPSS